MLLKPFAQTFAEIVVKEMILEISVSSIDHGCGIYQTLQNEPRWLKNLIIIPGGIACFIQRPIKKFLLPQ